MFKQTTGIPAPANRGGFFIGNPKKHGSGHLGFKSTLKNFTAKVRAIVWTHF
jgi:hypothetical protein